LDNFEDIFEYKDRYSNACNQVLSFFGGAKIFKDIILRFDKSRITTSELLGSSAVKK